MNAMDPSGKTTALLGKRIRQNGQENAKKYDLFMV